MSKLTPIQPFTDVNDPRQQVKVIHPLPKILFIVLAATLVGADDWEAIEEFAKSRESWLSRFVDMSTGVPSHDTLARVFSLLNPSELQEGFIKWVRSIIPVIENDTGKTLPPVVAVDGKTLRRSHDRSAGKSAIHMVNAWCTENSVVLGQLKTDEKSNEITAVPALLRLLDIEGRLVTADAMSCQKDIAITCIDQGADYLFAVKNNQPTLKFEIDTHLSGRLPKCYKKPVIDFYQTEEVSRDRYEVRRCWVSSADKVIARSDEWAGLAAIARVETERHHQGKVSLEQRYYICSRNLAAAELLQAARSHWRVESMHWMLDVGFNEDANRTRKDNAPENLAVVRQVTLNLLKQDKSTKLGIKNKRFKACNNIDYLEGLIARV